jgi:branched-chain amino acid transport system permease protein
MAAINYLLHYNFGLTTGLIHLAIILLIGWGLISLYRSGRSTVNIILFGVVPALDLGGLILVHLLVREGAPASIFLLIRFYMSPWIVVGVGFLVGQGLLALKKMGLRWLAVLILGVFMLINPFLLLILGRDIHTGLMLIGWGLQYLDYLTPVALIGILFIFPLREVTPRWGQRVIPAWLHFSLPGAFVLIFALSPLFMGRYYQHIMTNIGIYLISIYGLNILTGYCGLITLAQVALMGVGGYTAGLLAAHIGAPALITVPVAGLAAALGGLMLGVFSFLRGFALAMVTLFAASIFSYVLENVKSLESLTGGQEGLMLPVSNPHLIFYMILCGLILVLVVNEFITRTNLGRVMTNVREQQNRTPGSDYPYRILAFALSGFFAGISGGLLAHSMSFILPQLFDLHMALYVTFILIIGGMGTTIGPMVGVTLIIFLYDILFRNHGLDAYIMLLGVLAVEPNFKHKIRYS